MNIYKSSKLFLALSVFFSLFLIIYYIYISNYNKHIAKINEKKINYLLMQQSLPHYNRAASKQMLKIHNEVHQIDKFNSPIIPEKYDERVIKNRVIREKVQQLTSNISTKVIIQQLPEIFSMSKDLLIYNKTVNNVQIFYYMPIKWYKDEDARLFNVAFHPKIGFYNYSSHILKNHFQDIRKCGIGVVVWNWHPINKDLNDNFDKVLDIANEKSNNTNDTIKLAIQIDDYQDRTIESIRNNIKFIVDNFSGNPNFYKVFSTRKNKTLPVFYIKNSFLIKEVDWMRLLSKNGIITIRDTIYDCIIIGHIDKEYHKSFVRKSQFDGFYTYNVSNGATFGSTWKNWMNLKKFADLYNLLFIPSVGPGYYDMLAQPKYGTIRRFRSNGQYYEVAFRTALNTHTQFITIESYNNWVDGTQIEPATPATSFRDYQPGSPIKYLEITQHWVNQFYKTKQDSLKHDHKMICHHLLNDTIC